MKQRDVLPEPVHTAFWEEINGVFAKYEREHKLTPEVMLAIVSKSVGMLLAFQDPATMSNERALLTVSANIEAGNAQAITDMALGKIKR